MPESQEPQEPLEPGERPGEESPVAPDDTADPAASAPDQPAPTGRDRLLQALRRPARSQLIVAVLLAAMGFAAVTQVRSNEDDTTYAGYREQDLIDVLSGLAGTSQRARAELNRLEAARRQLESDTSAQQAALEQARKESDTLNVLAGLVPVTGPGIRVTITEVTGSVNADAFVDMVQELRNAGAEALQINGTVRVVAQSSFTDVTGGIRVDGQTLNAPYVVDVIGDPSALSGAMSILEGPRVDLQNQGAQVQIDELTSLDIEAVREPTQPEYAQPADAQ